MAIAVTGGQGNVQATIQNTDALIATVLHGEITIFTTPAIGNAMVRVFLSGVIITGDATPNHTTILGLVLPGKPVSPAGTDLDTVGLSETENTGADGPLTSLASELFVGPGTTIKIPYTMRNKAAEQGEFTYNISYHYAATVIT